MIIGLGRAPGVLRAFFVCLYVVYAQITTISEVGLFTKNAYHFSYMFYIKKSEKILGLGLFFQGWGYSVPNFGINKPLTLILRVDNPNPRYPNPTLTLS